VAQNRAVRAGRFGDHLIRDEAWEPMPISQKESGDRFKKLAWPYLKRASQRNDIQ